MTSGFNQLESELRAAEHRRTHRPRSQGGGRRQLVLPSLGSLTIVLSVVVAIGIAAGALLVLRSRPSQHAPRRAVTHVPALRSQVRALVSELAILRQPQTPADRAFNESGPAHRPILSAGFIPSLTRVLSLPHHGKLVLFVRAAGLGTLDVESGGGSGGCCETAGELRTPRGPGPIAQDSGSHATQIYSEVVPDGVARVKWTFPRANSVSGASGGDSLTVNVPVRDNVAASFLPRLGDALSDTWFAANGHVLATLSPHANDTWSETLRLARGHTQGSATIIAPSPARYVWDAVIVAPASTSIAVSIETPGEELSVLRSIHESHLCQVHGSRRASTSRCLLHFPLLPTELGGRWTVIVTKLSDAAALIGVAIIFHHP